jgi:hypothetical protein
VPPRMVRTRGQRPPKRGAGGAGARRGRGGGDG